MMNFDHFAKKIPAYFDGTLKDSERTELEAFVGSHPEFAQYFRQKETEQNTIKLKVPDHQMDETSLEALESEMKEIIKNLFKADDVKLTNRLASWFSDRL
jgi:anti-sigma factor RsiW